MYSPALPAGFDLIIRHSNESYDNEVANTRLMLKRQVDGIMVSLTLLEMLEQPPGQWRSHTVKLKTKLIIRQPS